MTTAQDFLQSVLTSIKDIQVRLDQLAEAGIPVPDTFRQDAQKLDSEAADLFDSLP